MGHGCRPGAGGRFVAPRFCGPVIERQLARGDDGKPHAGVLRQGVVGPDGKCNARDGIGVCAGQHGPHGSPDQGVQRPAVSCGVGGTNNITLIPSIGHIISVGHALRRQSAVGHGDFIQGGPFGSRIADVVYGLVTDFPGHRVIIEIALIVIVANAIL